MMVKMPEQAMKLPLFGMLYRDTCASSSVPNLCGIVSWYDSFSGTLSHEYVEATSDPFPRSGAIDINRFPAYERGEIADICQEDLTEDPAHKLKDKVRINNTVLETY